LTCETPNAQTVARSSRPPSSGRPGSRLSGRRCVVADPRRAGDQERDEWSGGGDEQFVARTARLVLDLGYSAEREQHDPPDRVPERQADEGVSELVGQDAQAEQDREAQGCEVGGAAADAGNGVLNDRAVDHREQ
jgi:hypothetical protein